MLIAREKRVHWPVASTLAASSYFSMAPRASTDRAPIYYIIAARRPVYNPENGSLRNYGVFARQQNEKGKNECVERARDNETTEVDGVRSESLTLKLTRNAILELRRAIFIPYFYQ